MGLNNNKEIPNLNDRTPHFYISSNESSNNSYSELDRPDDTLPTVKISRVAYDIQHFNELFESITIRKTPIERLKTLRPNISLKAWTRRFKIIFPILVWLPEYDIRKNLIADILSGATLSVFTIPQSIGIAMMAKVEPVIGLYTAFYPSLSYILLGTAPHSAIGYCHIASGLMTGNVVVQVKSELRSDSNHAELIVGYEDVTNLDIVIMTGVVCGLYMAAFGILQLGFLSDFMPNELIGGFLTSCSVYVFTFQISLLLGIRENSYGGVLALIQTYIQIFSSLKEVNLIALLISGVCLIMLLIFKEVVNVQIINRLGFKMVFPIELCLVIAGTLISSYMHLNERYDIDIIGAIPNGFVPPMAPKFKLFPYVWLRCIPIAIVGYVISIAAGKTMGVKHGYNMDPNQEMIAIGVTNIWSGIFRCVPPFASLPRVAIMDSSGGKTMVVHIVNCVFVAIVIATLGSLLSSLPNCVIGACVAIALTSLISKVKEAKHYWDISKIDASIWIITFVAVILLNIEIGFYVGLGSSIILLIYKSQRSKTYLLGSIRGTDIYVPIKKFNKAIEVRGVKIFQFCGPLNFANTNYFTSELHAKSGFDVNKLIANKKKAEGNDKTLCFRFRSASKRNPVSKISIESTEKLPTHIIIDCSMISFIDIAGANAIRKLVNKYKQIEVTIVLTGCAAHVERLLNKFEMCSTQVFKSIHDAIIHINGDNKYNTVYVKWNLKDTVYL